MTTPVLPAGAILAFAGAAGSPPAGWLFCDGTQYSQSDQSELYKAIGDASGGDTTAGTFAVPNLHGMFLRGQDSGRGLDPDLSLRVAAASGGNAGDLPGSVQPWATGNPSAHPFYARMWHLPTDYKDVYPTTDGDQLALYNGGGTNIVCASGGDAETRPPNVYVEFLIKATAAAALPVGAVIPYAGNALPGPVAQYWQLCDGTVLSDTAEAALGTVMGGASGHGDGTFNVPDYRGYFLRGTAHGSPRDPDRGSRSAQGNQGNVGDAVGSWQWWASGRPQNNSFYVGAPHLPNDPANVLENHLGGIVVGVWSTLPVNFAEAAGGGEESRPVNVAVDWYVARSAVASATTEPFPIGGVIAIPSTGVPSAAWLVCNGSPVRSGDQFFSALSATIGAANGGDGETEILLPDYRGTFLRGRDRSSGHDPDAGTRSSPAPKSGNSGDAVGSVQGWDTRRPGNAWLGTAQLPNRGVRVTEGLRGTGGSEWNQGSVDGAVHGGDDETRPWNASVVWYVRAA
jgi:microcystin-dependent protein